MEKSLANAKRLFLEFSENFELKFDHDLKIYTMPHKNSNKCHPLESCLIGVVNLKGQKLHDISQTIDQPVRWVLGFYGGYKGKKSRIKDINFLQGYEAGKLIREKNRNAT